jgi:hypothetical protein
VRRSTNFFPPSSSGSGMAINWHGGPKDGPSHPTFQLLIGRPVFRGGDSGLPSPVGLPRGDAQFSGVQGGPVACDGSKA